jgi:hypothetical protein
MTNMTVDTPYHEFLYQVQQVWLEGSWRYGQTLFNCLHTFRPDLADKVRTTPLDPFYKDHSDINPELWVFLMENW